jgi:hypothetical protein
MMLAMSTEIAAVGVQDFTGKAQLADSAIAVSLTGNADYAAQDALRQLLGGIHEAATQQPVKSVSFDLWDLEFMNSSCFKTLVSWITQVQELPDDARYQVSFRSNPGFHWQKRSLRALVSFAPELLTITEA